MAPVLERGELAQHGHVGEPAQEDAREPFSPTAGLRREQGSDSPGGSA